MSRGPFCKKPLEKCPTEPTVLRVAPCFPFNLRVVSPFPSILRVAACTPSPAPCRQSPTLPHRPPPLLPCHTAQDPSSKLNPLPSPHPNTRTLPTRLRLHPVKIDSWGQRFGGWRRRRSRFGSPGEADAVGEAAQGGGDGLGLNKLRGRWRLVCYCASSSVEDSPSPCRCRRPFPSCPCRRRRPCLHQTQDRLLYQI